MAKPFQEIVNIAPARLSTGQPQYLMSLSEKLDNFTSFVAQREGQKQIEKATIEGKQAGITQQQGGGKLELQEETFIGGIRKKAFNIAAREGYLKSLDNDIISESTRIASDNASNLVGFNESWNAYSKGVMESVDPSSRGAVQLSLESMGDRYRPKIQSAQAKIAYDSANEEQAINQEERGRLAQTSAFEGDNEQALLNMAAATDSIANRQDLDASEKADAIQALHNGINASSISGELARTFTDQGPQAAMDQLDSISDKPMKGFTPEEWDGFIKSQQTRITRKIARQKKITVEDKKAANLAASIERGAFYFNSAGGLVNPATGSQSVKDVNNFYNQESKKWIGLSAQEQTDLTVDFVNNTGIVPDQAIANINSVMRGGSDEMVAMQADIVSRIQEEAVASLADIPAESRAMALMVSDSQRSGMDVAPAIEAARKSAYGLTASQKAVISIKTQELAKNLPSSFQKMANTNVEDGGFDTGIFSNVPDIPIAMQADLRTSFDTFMTLTDGDADQSQKLAFETSKAKWAISETGGDKRFMPYAPEVMYKVPGMSSDWVADQFNEQMEDVGALGASITIDFEVARTRNPSYPIIVVNELSGMHEPLLDDSNQPVTFTPNVELTDEFREINGEPTGAVVSAKKQRKINMVKEANKIRRGIQARVLNSEFVPINERADYMASEEGKVSVFRAVNNMMAGQRIDFVQAKEALKGFDVEMTDDRLVKLVSIAANQQIEVDAKSMATAERIATRDQARSDLTDTLMTPVRAIERTTEALRTIK